MPPCLTSRRPRLLGLLVFALGLLDGGRSFAAAAKSLDAIYTPFRVEQIALAPDGGHAAFTLRTLNGGLEIPIFPTYQPMKKVSIPLDRTRDSKAHVFSWKSPQAARNFHKLSGLLTAAI